MQNRKDIGSSEEEENQPSGSEPAERAESKTKARKDSLDQLTEVILERSASAGTTLRAMLAGTVELFVRDRPYRVSFDFSANPPKIFERGSKDIDCFIEIDERNLIRIDQGELNPQLALVTDKIVVRGKAAMAVYFFNLLGF